MKYLLRALPVLVLAATDGSVNDKYYIDYIHGYAY